MEFLRNWIWVVVGAFLLGLFGLTAGCHVDGERWNHAMQEVWQSLEPQTHKVPPDSGFYLHFPDDVAVVVEDEPDGDG